MKVCLFVLLAAVPACLAGRAFPVISDSYATGMFQAVNPDIEKDATNFLVDLSGRYATCDRVGERGAIVVERKTPDAATIGGLVDFMEGSGTNAAIVASYIKHILSRWPGRSDFSEQIKRAEKFGCSVEPGCKGNVVVACLFSPEYSSDTENPGDINVKRALAFTPEQYLLAEAFLGMEWDKSHLLENLSGQDAECGMIGKASWVFKKAEAEAKLRGIHVSGLFGDSPNRGNTQAAMAEAMAKWKKVSFNKMGCSVIPDCESVGRGLQVVVVCLYQD